MPDVMPATVSEQPIILTANEVEDAFLAACDADTIRNIELRARLTQMVCFWHRLNEEERALVISHVRNYVSVH